MQLLHYCNSFLGGQLLHIAIFNSLLATIAIAIAIVLMAIANALVVSRNEVYRYQFQWQINEAGFITKSPFYHPFKFYFDQS